MTEQTLKHRALHKIAVYEAEIKKLRTFVEMYDTLGGDPLPSQPRVDTGEIIKQSNEIIAQVQALLNPRYATSDEIADAVREFLRGETEPMHISHLYRLVTGKGLRISGQNPKGNLSAKLAPYKDIKYVRSATGKSGWLLADMFQKVETPNGTRPNGASNHGEVDASPNSNPAQSGA